MLKQKTFFQDPEHIYIHWPFCKSKCHYCDFLSFCNKQNEVENYHKVLCKQIELFALKQNLSIPIKTIFLGGGTPSLYPLNLLKNLFWCINIIF